jgi:glycerophosphoryl diester phosphodiesterase
MLTPELVAHRGYPEHYPENTLIGIEAAIRTGARFVEVDIQLTADEVPVLLHDRTLQRVCGIKATVHHLPYEELRSFHPSEYDRFGYRFANVTIPSLAELAQLLRGHPGVTAFVELKSASLEHFGPTVVINRVLRELESVMKQVVLISFSFDALLTARKQRPLAVGAVIERWSERKQPMLRELRPQYLICDIGGLPRWGKLRIPDTRVIIYETVDPQVALRLARRGVEFVETFAIGEMLEALELLRGAS